MTLPFGASLLDKFSARQQAVSWKVVLRQVVEFRAYCCNISSDAIMGVTKEPVIIANISPTVVCLGFSISWNISSSYAPGSTLTAWEVDFDDGTPPASGADFPHDVTSGTHTYSAVGTYEITIYVEEGGPSSLSQTSTVMVDVVECEGEVLGEFMYASFESGGVYRIDMTADTTTWEERNEGLEDNALLVRSMTGKPSTRHLGGEQHELWLATADGIYRTIDGGGHWEKIPMPDPSNAEFGDVPAATVDELDWHKVVFDKTDEDIVYVLASKES